MIEPDPQKGLNPPDIWNTQDANAVALLSRLQTMIKSVRRDEQEGLILPWWLKFTLASTGGKRAFDTSAIVERYEKTIAMSVLADFILLGHNAVGSKALAATKGQLFTAAINSLLDSVCAIINRTAIPTLIRLNGVPIELCPTIGHSNVETVPLADLGTFIARLAQAGAPLFPNTDLLEALLDQANMPTSGIADAEANLSEGAQSGESVVEPNAGPHRTMTPADDLNTARRRRIMNTPSGRLPRMGQRNKMQQQTRNRSEAA